jgi:hypothetical protein
LAFPSTWRISFLLVIMQSSVVCSSFSLF